MARIVYGLEIEVASNLEDTIEDLFSWGYDFIVTSVVHPRYRRILFNPSGVIERNEPLTRSDKIVDMSKWTNSVVGLISDCIEMDSPIEQVRKNSEEVFHEEVNWIGHLGLPALVLPTPSNYPFPNFSNFVFNTAASQIYSQLWFRLPIRTEKEVDTWVWWDSLRMFCEHSVKLSVALELTQVLPSEEELERWMGEPVRCLFIPTSIFTLNHSGYPILPKEHQKFIMNMMKFTPMHIVLTGNTEISLVEESAYVQYLRHLEKNLPQISEQEKSLVGYYDFLQAPLQPLMDNLESTTYDVFEKDPVKYREYEEAVYQALITRFSDLNRKPVIMVAGAGRGPLVNCSIRASARANIPVKLYAIEKNKNAIITLKNAQREEWGDSVTIISSDMRFWDAPEKADILVSELLGSFGDNELSPECLDGAQKFLRDDGISIPADYTSYITPITSSKLFNEVKLFNDLEHFETPFVVKLKNFDRISDIQPLFKFIHPNYTSNGSGKIDNTRYGSTIFKAKTNATIHGIAGYFHSTLYKDVFISIHPENHSPGMFSWFPILFPLRMPVHVKKGEEIRVDFWRKVSDRKVWYEWTLVTPITLPIQNPGGRSYWIGL